MDIGPVRRRAFGLEPSGHWNDRGELQFGRGPYAHDLDGVYRPRRER